MIVAITGGTGFVGKHLVARHVARGDQVRYLTRGGAATDTRDASPHIGDLNCSADELRQFVHGVDVLYHCAAEIRIEAEMHNTNVLGTANLLAAAAGEIGRWVQLSSTGVYGGGLHRDINEGAAINPANVYEKSKATSDNLVMAAAARQNLPCVLLRPSNVYGTDMRNQSLYQLITMIDRGLFFFVGKHGAIANYIQVENVVDALVLCGTADLSINGRAYIVSDHRTVEEFVGMIAAALGRERPRMRLPESLVRAVVALAGSIPTFPLNSSRVDALTNRAVYRADRIGSELGYKNRISMEDGIGEFTRHWKRWIKLRRNSRD